MEEKQYFLLMHVEPKVLPSYRRTIRATKPTDTPFMTLTAHSSSSSGATTDDKEVSTSDIIQVYQRCAQASNEL
jgi:predicted nucleic acid-binding protein